MKVVIVKKKKTYKRAKMALYRSSNYQTMFEAIGLYVREEKFNIDYQDGDHLNFQSE